MNTLFALVSLVAIIGGGVVAVAGVRALLLRVGESRWSVAAAFTLSLFAALPSLLGQVFGGVVGGFALVSLVLAVVALYHTKQPRSEAPLPSLPSPPSLPLPAVASLLFVFAAMSWIILSTNLSDENTGHYGLAASMARGMLPAEHPLYPGEPFRYHVGYDVMVAVVRGATLLPIDVCCDVVTLLCLVVLLAVLVDVARALSGAKAIGTTIIVVFMGASPFALCLADGWGANIPCVAWFPATWVNEDTFPPTIASNFLQHPQGLGMSVSVALLLFLGERVSHARVAIAAVVVACLSQCQVVFFGITGLALAVIVTIDALAQRSARLLAIRLAMLLLAAGASFLLGGMLRPSHLPSGLIAGAGFFGPPSLEMVARNLATFGATVLAVFVAPLRWKDSATRLRIALTVAGAIGFVVANAATYERSWDIVKFFGVSAFFANILLADVLFAVAERVRAKRALLVGLVAVNTFAGFFWVLRSGPLNEIVAPGAGRQPPDQLAVALDAAYRDVIPAEARILTSAGEVFQLGFRVVGANWRWIGTGYILDRERLDAERAVAVRALQTFQQPDLDALEVDFIVLHERGLRGVSDEGRAALGDVTRFERLADVPLRNDHLEVYRRVRP